LLLRRLGFGTDGSSGRTRYASAGRGGKGASLMYGASSAPKRSSSLMYALGVPKLDLRRVEDEKP